MKAGIRKLATVAAIATVAVIPTIAGTAGASIAPGSAGYYSADATATALQLSIAGQTLTEGVTNTHADTSPNATASGIGDLLVPGSQQSVSATQPGTTQSKPQTCATPPSPAPGLTVGLSCGGPVQAAVDSTGLSSSSAAANGAAISLGGTNPLTSLNNAITSGGASLVGTLTTLFANTPLAGPLNTAIGSIASGGTTLSALLGSLGSALPLSTTLISVGAASSTSAITSSATSVQATSSAKAVTIQLLPGAIPGLSSLATIIVTPTTTTATLDRTTGMATSTDVPAIVSVSVGGQPAQTITPGQSVPGIPNTPLSTLLTLTLLQGSSTQGAGSASAQADSLSLNLLPGLAPGGTSLLSLVLGKTTASVTGLAVAPNNNSTPPGTQTAANGGGAAPTVVPNVTSVHTGEPWAGALPLAGAALAAGLALVWRRRLASMIPSLAGAGRSVGATAGQAWARSRGSLAARFGRIMHRSAAIGRSDPGDQ